MSSHLGPGAELASRGRQVNETAHGPQSAAAGDSGGSTAFMKRGRKCDDIFCIWF